MSESIDQYAAQLVQGEPWQRYLEPMLLRVQTDCMLASTAASIAGDAHTATTEAAMAHAVEKIVLQCHKDATGKGNHIVELGARARHRAQTAPRDQWSPTELGGEQ